MHTWFALWSISNTSTHQVVRRQSIINSSQWTRTSLQLHICWYIPCFSWFSFFFKLSLCLLLHFLQDHDFFQHLEMHMRSEFPPLCGRDHLSFRSYYFPVKVGIMLGVYACVCVNTSWSYMSNTSVNYVNLYIHFSVLLSRMWLMEICASSLTAWTLTSRRVWQKNWTEHHQRSLRNLRIFAPATPSNHTQTQLQREGMDRYTFYRTFTPAAVPQYAPARTHIDGRLTDE